jgi:hypothetical protein
MDLSYSMTTRSGCKQGPTSSQDWRSCLSIVRYSLLEGSVSKHLCTQSQVCLFVCLFCSQTPEAVEASPY